MKDIIPQRKNANRHTQRGMQALERSIDEGGWIGAVTVAADGETFDGSARVEKLAENGMLDDAITIDIDGTKPVILRRTDIPNATDPRAVKLGIAANRVASLNLDWEPGVLAELAGEVDLSGLFYPHELAGAAQPVDPAELWKGMPEFEQEDLGSWKSVNVHFANEDDYQAFFRLVKQIPNARSIWFPEAPKTDMYSELYVNES